MPTPDPWTPRSGLPPVGTPVTLRPGLTFTTVNPAASQGLLRQPAATIKSVWTQHGDQVELRLKDGTLLLTHEHGKWSSHHPFVQATPPLDICRDRVAHAIRALTPAEVTRSGSGFGIWELGVETLQHSGTLTYEPQTRPPLRLTLWAREHPEPTTSLHVTVRGVLRSLQALKV